MNPIINSIADFPDRLSPMLVKELRQGLRAKTFVTVYLALQGFLGLVLLFAGAGATSAKVGNTVSAFVFALYAVVILVIQPLRGISAMSSEIRGQTIDLMVLTKLSAFRIILGKWMAIVSQSALITATIIPYLILRYYFGAMNLFAELALVGLIFICSAGLSAIHVGLSTLSHILVRGILPLIGAVALLFVIIGVTSGNELQVIISTLSSSGSNTLYGILALILIACYLGWYALSLGASLFAPHAENHSTTRRLISLGCLALVPLYFHFGRPSDLQALWIWFLVTAPAIAVALSEKSHSASCVTEKFSRKGLVGRIAATFFHPGWRAGTAFSLLLGVLSLISFAVLSLNPRDEASAVGLFGSLLLPGLIVVCFGSKMKDRVASYFLLWIVFFLLAVTILGILDSSSRSSAWAFAWNPVMLSLMTEHHAYDTEMVAGTATVVSSIYMGLLLTLASISAVRNRRNVTHEAAE